MGLTRHLFSFATTFAGAAVCACAYYAIPAPPGVAPHIAWACSLGSLMLSISSLDSFRWDSISTENNSEHSTAKGIARHVALYLGVAAGMIQLILLTMRCVYVGIDLVHGYPWQGVRDYGFGQAGLWTIVALAAACGFGLLVTRDSKKITVQFWILAVLAMWACLLGGPFQATKTGGFERTDTTLILAECLAGLILVAVVLTGWVTETSFLRPPAGKDLPSGKTHTAARELPPGFCSSVAVLALALNIAVLFHILVPAGQSTSILRMSGVRAGIAALVAATGCLFLLRRCWGAHLADACLGLYALSLCGLATIAVPWERIPLDQRYPMILNAITVGYTLAAGAFAHLSCTATVPNLSANATRNRMVPHLNRFAFFSGATALLSGVMMCFWPGLPGISAMDHSLGRVLSGFAAFLFLLLVTLRSSRILERLSFHFLTVAVAASMVAFLVVRALPFTSDHSH